MAEVDDEEEPVDEPAEEVDVELARDEAAPFGGTTTVVTRAVPGRCGEVTVDPVVALELGETTLLLLSCIVAVICCPAASVIADGCLIPIPPPFGRLPATFMIACDPFPIPAPVSNDLLTGRGSEEDSEPDVRPRTPKPG